MNLDLRKDRRSLLKHIKERVREYPIYVNEGPGEDEDPIMQITLGYQFDQAGWVAMVIDTRTDAAVDGVWQNYIEENEQELPLWCNVYEELYENEGTVDLISPDGSKDSLAADDNLAEVIGEVLRDLLVACRDDGLFGKLPLAANLRLTVEEHEGQYCWTIGGDEQDEEETEDPFLVTDDLRTRIGKLPKQKQIAFWIKQLQEIAADVEKDPEDYVYDVFSTSDELAKIGNDAVVPMLKLALKLADKPEFEGAAT